jgi:hypothetical protein
MKKQLGLRIDGMERGIRYRMVDGAHNIDVWHEGQGILYIQVDGKETYLKLFPMSDKQMQVGTGRYGRVTYP